jgi:hypothetical protein
LLDPVREHEITCASAIGARRGLAPAGSRAVFVVNTDTYFLTHRATWATALRASGWGVHVLAADSGDGQTIRDLGLRY